MAFCHESYRPFEVTVQRDHELATIMVSGELDLATVPQLSATVAEHDDAGLLVLDLTAVTFIDSTGVRVLIQPTAPARARAHASWCWPATGRCADCWTCASSTAAWRWSQSIRSPPPSLTPEQWTRPMLKGLDG